MTRKIKLLPLIGHYCNIFTTDLYLIMFVPGIISDCHVFMECFLFVSIESESQNVNETILLQEYSFMVNLNQFTKTTPCSKTTELA